MGATVSCFDAIGQQAPPGTLAASGTCTSGREWYAFMKISGLHIGDVLQVSHPLRESRPCVDVIDRAWVGESEAVLWRPR